MVSLPDMGRSLMLTTHPPLLGALLAPKIALRWTRPQRLLQVQLLLLLPQWQQQQLLSLEQVPMYRMMPVLVLKMFAVSRCDSVVILRTLNVCMHSLKIPDMNMILGLIMMEGIMTEMMTRMMVRIRIAVRIARLAMMRRMMMMLIDVSRMMMKVMVMVRSIEVLWMLLLMRRFILHTVNDGVGPSVSHMIPQPVVRPHSQQLRSLPLFLGMWPLVVKAMSVLFPPLWWVLVVRVLLLVLRLSITKMPTSPALAASSNL